jgi:hypothetical protein
MTSQVSVNGVPCNQQASSAVTFLRWKLLVDSELEVAKEQIRLLNETEGLDASWSHTQVLIPWRSMCACAAITRVAVLTVGCGYRPQLATKSVLFPALFALRKQPSKN